ncbi:MAG: class I SAM-dependent rRNA methyltransferase [Deltaproteobacteria bacterium]|nr:class I SAM-dependent rRNA methyltransferase [Deltaproteobacteria bacterium]
MLIHFQAMSLPNVEISRRAAKRIRSGHVWVYRSDLRSSEAEKGDIVRVVSRHGSGGTNELGVAFYNPESLISLRLIDRQVHELNREFWAARFRQAIENRKELPDIEDMARLVFGEADCIPGLIVDRYGDVLVIQTGCAGSDHRIDLWIDILEELLSPAAIAERNDSSTRRLERLESRCGVLRGRVDGPVEVREGGLRQLVDPLSGQKTGAYLDQRENRLRSAEYARGRCLDVFSYQGGFALQLARGGAGEVLCVDQSERALEAARAAARLNGLTVSCQTANAFDFLRELQGAGERFDVICLDPPAFAKNRKSVERAERGYKEINLRAIKLLRSGGVLITSSCSYHMLEPQFENLLREAGQDGGRTLQVLERRSQSRDHPVRLGFPESRYLKCFVLRVI